MHSKKISYQTMQGMARLRGTTTITSILVCDGRECLLTLKYSFNKLTRTLLSKSVKGILNYTFSKQNNAGRPFLFLKCMLLYFEIINIKI